MNELLIPAHVDHVAAMFPLMPEHERVLLRPERTSRLILVSELSWCAIHDGEPMCLGGVTRTGIAWMISTPELNRQKRFFLRQSAVVMRHIRRRFSHVAVTVDVCYTRSVRWLLWLGFSAAGVTFKFEKPTGVVLVQRFDWDRI